MKVYRNELNMYFDVDDTLIMSDLTKGDRIVIKCPYKKKTVKVRAVHANHVKLVKDVKSRGYTVVVWSAGGARWAEAVVKALKLTKYVDVVITKPMRIVDDLEAHEFMSSRIYLK